MSGNLKGGGGVSRNLDIYLVGVGGQGVLTIGEILIEVAQGRGIPVNFYPTKGMAQRGGFVKAQLRLGRKVVGPNIPERGADIVIAMERSEALKAVRYIKPGGEFLLYGYVWAPTAVMLGKAPYPALEQVIGEIENAGGKVCYLDPGALPEFQGRVVSENIYVLGTALGDTALREVFNLGEVAEAVGSRWKKARERNLFALQAGFTAPVGPAAGAPA